MKHAADDGKGKGEGASLLSLSPLPSSPVRASFLPQASTPYATPTKPLQRREVKKSWDVVRYEFTLTVRLRSYDASSP